MAEYKLLLPSMGEGVMEATIISWLINEGDTVLTTGILQLKPKSPVNVKIVQGAE